MVEKKETRGYYLKFDLTKASLSEVPDLLDFYKATGAMRACVVFKTHGAWERVPVVPVTYTDDTNWRTIKVPSLDGTELWIVPESKQAEIEFKMGFGKPSAHLLSTSSRTIHALAYRDPLYRSEIRFRQRTDVICTSLTGATLLSPTANWTLEQLETIKDLGSFAFED